jgi:hypothetical protein
MRLGLMILVFCPILWRDFKFKLLIINMLNLNANLFGTLLSHDVKLKHKFVRDVAFARWLVGRHSHGTTTGYQPRMGTLFLKVLPPVLLVENLPQTHVGGSSFFGDEVRSSYLLSNYLSPVSFRFTFLTKSTETPAKSAIWSRL